MTPELWTFIGIGVAIAALTLAQARQSNRLIHGRIRSMETHMNGCFQTLETHMYGCFQTLEMHMNDRFQTMESHMNDRFQRIEIQIAELRERMAHLEGLLEGLCEDISERRVA